MICQQLSIIVLTYTKQPINRDTSAFMFESDYLPIYNNSNTDNNNYYHNVKKTLVFCSQMYYHNFVIFTTTSPPELLSK